MKDNKRKSKKEPRLVMVRWIDAFGPTVPWTEVEDIDMTPSYCVSVGFIVARNKHYIAVAPHFSPSGSVFGECKIPVACVDKIWRLTRKNKKGGREDGE